MCPTFLTESFPGYSLVSVLAVFVVMWLFVLRPPAVNREQTQVSKISILGEGRPLPKSGLVQKMWGPPLESITHF